MRRALERELPALRHLLGAYLHQDYDLTGTIDENVALFAADEPDLAEAVPDEVARVLRKCTEAEAEALIVRLGAEILPPDGLTYREWLTQIADHVRAATAGGASATD